MRVHFDAQIFNAQRFGGISRLFTELFKCFDRDDTIDWELSLDLPNNEYIREMERTGSYLTGYKKFLWGARFKGKGRIYQALLGTALEKNERQRTVRRFKNQCIDLFHPTYYDDYFVDFLEEIPFVITVHDMIHEIYPAVVNDPDTIVRKKRLVERAQRIIAVSENTKKDLVEITGINPNKIDVVPLASSIGGATKKKAKVVTDFRYILYVGQRGGYKNFERFFRAVVPLMLADKTMHLLCVGGRSVNGKFSDGESLMIAEAGLTGRVVLKGVTDQELEAVYAGAICFVFPSLYEGFGIPMLEAFGCGCPVAASDRSSLPEIGGDGAEYFDPESEESMRDTVDLLLSSSERREDLTARGRQRAKQYSWPKTARKTVDVYRKAML